MQLKKRPSVYSMPSYSLTGDLLGFLRCGLNYRFTRVGQFPTSRPVQLWFGQFVHGVMEEAYRRYNVLRESKQPVQFPWPDKELTDKGGIFELIRQRLLARGISPRDKESQNLGENRSRIAINELGPYLFPIIHKAEVRLTGTRILPTDQIKKKLGADFQFREADRYEIIGIVDVITHIELYDPELQDNQLVKLILKALPSDPPKEFELIIDYKGMRRPPSSPKNGGKSSYWDIYGWQVQTYAHLRERHEDSLPVVAGLILYLNEFHPTRQDLRSLKREMRTGETDVTPEANSADHLAITSWQPKSKYLPDLSFDYRLQRALRLEVVSNESITESLDEFDKVVVEIEVCRGNELSETSVLKTWKTNTVDDNTCKACDARTFCPDYQEENSPKRPTRKASS